MPNEIVVLNLLVIASGTTSIAILATNTPTKRGAIESRRPCGYSDSTRKLYVTDRFSSQIVLEAIILSFGWRVRILKATIAGKHYFHAGHCLNCTNTSLKPTSLNLWPHPILGQLRIPQALQALLRRWSWSFVGVSLDYVLVLTDVVLGTSPTGIRGLVLLAASL